jgi:AcrR family transcriptional regulator
VAAESVRIPNASRGRTADTSDGDATQKRRGTGRTIRGRQSRQLLLDAARAVFEREGFLRTRIADIAKEAKVSHGTFYTYFFSKEEVFREIVDSVEIDLLRSEPVGSDDPIERIRVGNRHYLEAFRDNAAILRVIKQVSTFDDEVRKRREEPQSKFAVALMRRTRAYQEQGHISSDLDPWITANALGGMVSNFADLMFIQGHSFDLDLVVDQLTTLWARAVGLES